MPDGRTCPGCYVFRPLAEYRPARQNELHPLCDSCQTARRRASRTAS